MQISLTHAMCLTALIVASGTTNAAATPLTPFRYEAQAQGHCPADTVVWLDFREDIRCLAEHNGFAVVIVFV
jgi:hypothetical protein